MENLGMIISMSKNTIISEMIRVRGSLDVGDCSIVDDFCYFAADILLGEYVHISHNVTVLGGGQRCEIGDFSAIGPGVRIVCASDDYSGGLAGPNVSTEFKGNPIYGDVKIGRHCVIGANSVILPGVTIPDGCAIGALSMVRSEDKLEPYGIYAGVPLRFIRRRRSGIEAAEKAFKASEE